MKHSLLYILFLASTICQAQTDTGTTSGLAGEADKSSVKIDAPRTDVGESPLSPDLSSELKAGVAVGESKSDSLSLPLLSWQKPTLFTMWQPWMPFGMGGWNVHKGLNAQIEAGVMVGFGKHNPFRGASFFTDVALLYAQPVNDRWTLAVGADVSRFRMWKDDVYTARVEAMANYKINERLDATVFGSHQFMPMGGIERPRYMPFLDRCSEIGASLTWKCNDNCSLGVSIIQSIVDSRR